MASAGQKAAKSFRIFIGNLHWSHSVRDVKEYFSNFGSLKKTIIKFDNKGISKGYGFVEFSEEEAFKSALIQSDHILKGQRLSVLEAGSGKKYRYFEKLPNQNHLRDS